MNVDFLLKEILAKSRVAAGSAQVIRLCQQRKLSLVILASDSAEDLIVAVRSAATAAGIRLILTGSRHKLGELAGERRPTTALGVFHDGSDVLLRFTPETPIEWDLDLLIWFHESRFLYLEGGYKKATLRMGMRRPVALRLGVVDVSTAEVRGAISIDEVAWLKWGDVRLRPDILRNEYPSQWELLSAEMVEVYPTLDSNTWLTYYKFTYEPI